MAEEEMTETSEGELVYDDEMFVEESLLPRGEQRTRNASSERSGSGMSTPCLRFESRFESGNLRKGRASCWAAATG
eukprot:760589-Hanusia_phi.AAC.1